ncbi:hypothetical protein [Cypionkella sp.]|uniref:hypothetical protein n=1 Tax=Cypionkella sp. TaxID=2811411 RepID=UPI0026243EC8|nr:hypothetical protein [Cypionkella sp.]MDB5663642.1 hypothetical protein [Cypionkella sp.]
MRLRIAPALSLVAVLCAASAQADTPMVTPPSPPMTGAEFEAYVTGKTLTYALGGTVYGTEQYKAGRKVVWAFTEDECREGYWYESGPEICFVYEDPNDPQCWMFFMGKAGMSALFTGDGGGADLSEIAQSSGPMACMGPQVGV